MPELHHVFVAIGGNIGDAKATVRQAALAIKAMKEVYHMRLSRVYQTKPVGPPQPDFMNAVCAFNTPIPPVELLERLKGIERLFGRSPGVKDGPRVIDLDILLYGTKRVHEEKLQVPHPRWLERLFVLVPLMDLTDQVQVPDQEGEVQLLDLQKYMDQFPNTHHEKVFPVGE